MAYSDFNLETAIKDFALVEKRTRLFERITPLEKSNWLEETLTLSLDYALSSPSEKAKSEFIVVPILLEMERRNKKSFAIHSGKRFDVDSQRGLNGECDFILAKGEMSHIIQTPVFALVEAKKNDIEFGLGQCVAQMVGAKLFNQTMGNEIETIFGCVTTGEAWQFLKLKENTIFIDKDRYYINQIENILGVLQAIIDNR